MKNIKKKISLISLPVGSVYEDVLNMYKGIAPKNWLAFDNVERKNVDYPELINLLKRGPFSKWVGENTFILPSIFRGINQGHLLIKAKN